MEKVKNAIFDFFRRTDKIFWLLTISATLYGFILIFSMSRAGGGAGFGFMFTQFLAVFIGYSVAIFLSTRDYGVISFYWIFFALAALAMLIYTQIFGWGPQGVDDKSWVSFGPINFQPTELVKIIFLITFSKHMSILKDRGLLETFKGVFYLGIHLLILVVLIHIQGDDGTALVFVFMFLFMTFGGKVQLRYFTSLIIALSVSIPLIWNLLLNEDQKSRFLAVLDLDSSLLGAGWQQYQGKISIASGELTGRGLFQGPRVSSGVVPYQESDFIFTVAGEELGLIGCVVLIAILFLMCLRALKIGMMSRDLIGKSICFGFFGMVFSQATINIAMCLGLIPVIGITLPFFSSGGSSVMCLYFGVGLVQSVYACRNDSNKVSTKSIRLGRLKLT
ncbi:MAG: FtsW/RodA/SpoVE family cell cycle protein [Clostridia bacterium]|nr:FtsW/RodA/SpoVE family cell cycle protein [Clostridia bacterium]